MNKNIIKSKTNLDSLTNKDCLPNNMYNYLNQTIGSKKVIKYLGVRTTGRKKDSVWQYECKCGSIGVTSGHTLKYKPSDWCSKCMHYEMRKPTPIDMGDYYLLKTSSGYEYFIDKEDYDKIKMYTWHKHQDGYLRTRIDVIDGKNKYILLHNLLLDRYDAVNDDVDHINRMPYDNRRCNLRIVSHAENMRNIGIKSSSTSGFSGVHFAKRENKWKAYISFNNNKIHIGTFKTKEEAINARANKEIELGWR